ncbi:Uncharacterised protein [Escherichia coli]|nr:Uncharacterised protein [Escherichia coli]SRB28210.1 Uncharacterised protein [Escherichia coli]
MEISHFIIDVREHTHNVGMFLKLRVSFALITVCEGDLAQ